MSSPERCKLYAEKVKFGAYFVHFCHILAKLTLMGRESNRSHRLWICHWVVDCGFDFLTFQLDKLFKHVFVSRRYNLYHCENCDGNGCSCTWFQFSRAHSLFLLYVCLKQSSSTVYEVFSSLFLPEKEMDYWLCGIDFTVTSGMRFIV